MTLQFLQTSPFPPTKTSKANDAEETDERDKGDFTNFTDTRDPSPEAFKQRTEMTQVTRTRQENLLRPISKKFRCKASGESKASSSKFESGGFTIMGGDGILRIFSVKGAWLLLAAAAAD